MCNDSRLPTLLLVQLAYFRQLSADKAVYVNRLFLEMVPVRVKWSH